MIATATNTLRGVSPASFNLMPSVGTAVDFPPVAWVSEPTQFEALVPVAFPDSETSIPNQRFVFLFSPGNQKFRMESLPSDDWPKIILELEADSMGSYQAKPLKVSPSSQTASAEIKFTRFELLLAQTKACTFDIGLEAPLRIRFPNEVMTQDDLNQLRHRAKIFRKLGFLEKVFRHKFNYPTVLLPSMVGQIELLFRGVTEGQFTTRLESFRVAIDPATVDLKQPPWNRPGYFRHMFTERENLFGTIIDTGPIWLEAFHANIGSYKAIRQIEQRMPPPVEAPFALLDHQITFRFERYASRSSQERESKLRQYLHELSREEPKSIYDLTLEPLTGDVNWDDANHLATGWTQIHDLPDRYCSQLPTLDESGKFWRVPLWLTYPSGKGAAVADLFVDVKTGIVTPSIPLSEIRIRGKQLAQQLLHASETAVLQAGD